MGRALLLGLAMSAALALGTAPASADDPTPAPTPTGSVTVSPPSQQQIDDARSALDRLRDARTSPSPVAEVAGPVAPARHRRVVPRMTDEAWWIVGAGVLVLLVASESTRLGVRRARHRRRA
jgi:hypothetical protein